MSNIHVQVSICRMFICRWPLNMSMNINFIKRLKQPITIIEQRATPMPNHCRSDSLFNIENTISGQHKSMRRLSVLSCALSHSVYGSLAAYHVTNEKWNKCPPAYTARSHVQNQVKRLLIASCFCRPFHTTTRQHRQATLAFVQWKRRQQQDDTPSATMESH